MGQQQMLLLVLGAVIVTIAVAVAINIFISRSGAIAEQYLNDTINDCLQIAQKAQAWARKPAELGGGGWSFQNFSLRAISFPESTNYARYEIQNSHDSIVIKAVTITGHKVSVTATFDDVRKPVVERLQ